MSELLPKIYPARCLAEQVAEIIGCCKHDIPILIRAKLLQPLGHPTSQAVKYFSRKDIKSKCQDDKWLSKMTDAIYGHWRKQHAKMKDESDITEGKNSI